MEKVKQEKINSFILKNEYSNSISVNYNINTYSSFSSERANLVISEKLRRSSKEKQWNNKIVDKIKQWNSNNGNNKKFVIFLSSSPTTSIRGRSNVGSSKFNQLLNKKFNCIKNFELFTTQVCCCCGATSCSPKIKRLNGKVVRGLKNCNNCGTIHNRDLNSAWNQLLIISNFIERIEFQ